MAVRGAELQACGKAVRDAGDFFLPQRAGSKTTRL